MSINSVKPYAFTIVIGFFAVFLFSLYLLPRVNFSLLVVPKQQSLSVTIFYPKTQPIFGEKDFTANLEGELALMAGIEDIKSVSRSNSATITVKFKEGVDMRFTYLHFRSIVRRAQADFPYGTRFPQISKGNALAAQSNRILTYGIYSGRMSKNFPNELQRLSKKHLSFIEGVENVEISGEIDTTLIIFPNLKKMAHWGISLENLEAILASQGLRQFIQWRGHREEKVLDLGLPLVSAEALPNVAVGKYGAKLIRLKDIAEFQFTESYQRTIYKINGERTFSISFDVSSDANVLEVAKRIKFRMNNLREDLDSQAELSLIVDKVEDVEYRLRKLVWQNAWALMLLFLALTMLSRNLVYGGILFMGLLMVFSLTLIGCVFFQISINLFSLAATVVAFGIIVDNSILMIEGLERGSSSSTENVLVPIVGASLTTILGISGIFLLPEELGQNLQGFAQLIILALLSSVLIAGLFIPALAYMCNFTPPLSYSKEGSLLENILGKAYLFINRKKKFVIVFLIWLVGFPMFMLPAKWEAEHVFADLYNKSIGSDFYQNKMRGIVDPLLGTSLYLFSQKASVPYFSQVNVKPQILVEINPLDSNSGKGIPTLMEEFERILKVFTDKLSFQSYLTEGEEGRIEIQFKEDTKSEFHYKVKALLEIFANGTSNVSIEVIGIGLAFNQAGRNNDPPTVILELRGYDYDRLDQYTQQVSQIILSHPRVDSVNTFAKFRRMDRIQSQTKLRLDYDNMQKYGVEEVDILNQLKLLESVNLAKSSVTLGKEGDFSENLAYTLKRKDYISSWQQTSSTPVLPFSHTFLPLRAFFTEEKVNTPPAVYRENQSYIRKITYKYKGASTFAQKHIDKVLQEFEPQLESGYQIEQKPVIRFLTKEENAYQFLLIALTILAIFASCSILFNSFSRAFSVLLTIPISLAGAFYGMYFFDINYDEGTFAGLVLLAGLAVNNSILIIYPMSIVQNPSLKTGLSISFKKARPILLTLFTTCVSLLPMLWDKDGALFWYNLSSVTICGLLFSIPFLFLIIPLTIKERP